MVEHVRRISFYTPSLEIALPFYQTLGLHLEADVTGRAGHRSVEFAFPFGKAKLVPHDDPLLQFTDVELKVRSVLEAYQSLKCNPSIVWLQLPTQTSEGWRASLRGPDGNVLVLSS